MAKEELAPRLSWNLHYSRLDMNAAPREASEDLSSSSYNRIFKSGRTRRQIKDLRSERRAAKERNRANDMRDAGDEPKGNADV